MECCDHASGPQHVSSPTCVSPECHIGGAWGNPWLSTRVLLSPETAERLLSVRGWAVKMRNAALQDNHFSSFIGVCTLA